MHLWFSDGMKRDTHGCFPLNVRGQQLVLERGEYA